MLRGQVGMAQNELFVTILINNYNYGCYLRQAIDSALLQTYTDIEVLVVDDGSTDESRDIIRGYGRSIRSIFKDNEGQASAFNVGIAASRGTVICLLDSDDFFHPEKVETIVPLVTPGTLLNHGLAVHGPGSTLFLKAAGSGNYYRDACSYRFVPCMASPTSGLVLSRDLALRLIPLPTAHVRSSADDFLVRGAALVGRLLSIANVLSSYRVHGNNTWYGRGTLKSPEFMSALVHYLNDLLVQNGKTPVIDFYHSMYARDYIPQRSVALARLAYEVFAHHPDYVTARFAGRTLLRALRMSVSSSHANNGRKS